MHTAHIPVKIICHEMKDNFFAAFWKTAIPGKNKQNFVQLWWKLLDWGPGNLGAACCRWRLSFQYWWYEYHLLEIPFSPWMTEPRRRFGRVENMAANKADPTPCHPLLIPVHLQTRCLRVFPSILRWNQIRRLLATERRILSLEWVWT